jgi:outer membrane protein, multidrug efflux system
MIHLPKGELSISHQSQQQILPGISGEVARTESFRTGASFNWTFDLSGRISRVQEVALADYQASQFSFKDIQLDIVAEAVNTYAKLAATELQIEIAQRTLASLRQTEQVVVDRVASGYASDFDLLRVKSQVVTIEADIPELQILASILENTLSALRVQQSTKQPDIVPFMVAPTLIRPIAIVQPVELLRQRADIRLAERQLAAATSGIGIMQADLYPELSITGFLGFLSADTLNLNHANRALSLTPTLSWQAFDLASVKARVKVANAHQQMALANLQQQWLNAITQTKAALQTHIKSQEREAMFKHQVSINQQMLKLARFQYQAGTLELLDLLDAERVTLASEYQKVTARQLNMSSLIELYRVFGGGLTPESAKQVFAKVR